MARGLPMHAGRGGKPQGPRPKAKKGTLKRLLGLLFRNNKKLIFVAFTCLVISAITGVSSSIFLNKLLTYINIGLSDGLDTVIKSLIGLFVVMGAVYLTSIVCSFIQTRTMAVITQRFLHQIRTSLFDKMQ